MSTAITEQPHATDVGTVDARNPWPGLASFREADHEFFHGRKAESEALLRLLRRSRLTVLFGLSGLGKTSLLRAAVFPGIRGDEVLPVLIRLDYSADSPPLADQVRHAVAEAAAEAGVDGAQSLDGATLWETFHRRDVELWSERHRLMVPLLVFDQFEEIFTLGRRDAATRAASEAFLEELADLIEARPPETLKARLEADPRIGRELNFGRHPYKVMLSLREDFLPQLEELRERIGSLAHNRFRLRPMDGEAALSVVIQNPELIEPEVAERVVRFVAAADPGDTDAPLEQLRVEPALLSVVCRELNNRRRRRGEERITSGLLDERREEILAGIYERSVADAPEELRAFVEESLLTVSGYRDSVALENALDLPGVTREHLDRLVDRRLLRIEERAGVRRVELTHDLLTGVVAHSRDERRRREQEKEQRRARLEAEAEAREVQGKLRRSRILAAIFLVLTLMSVVLAVWAFRERTRAEDLAVQARNNAILIAADSQSDPLVRTLLLGEMRGSVEPPRGIQTAWRAVQETVPLVVLSGHQDMVLSVAFSPSGDRIVTGSSDKTARIWKTDGSDRDNPIVIDHQDTVRSVAFSPSGDRIVTRSEDRMVRIWKADDRDEPVLLEGHQGVVGSEAFSSSGDRIVTISPHGKAHWEADGSDRDEPVVVEGYKVVSAAFSPSGDRIVTGSEDGMVRIWEADGYPVVVLRGHQDDVESAAFSPSGDRIVTGSSDGRARIWKADGSDRDDPLVLEGHERHVLSVAFSPSGDRIVTGSEDKTARIWKADGSDRKAPIVFQRHKDWVAIVAFSPSGGHIVTGSGDKTARSWKADGSDRGEPVVLQHQHKVNHVAFSPSGDRIVTRSWDGAARIWQADGSDRNDPIVLQGEFHLVNVAFSPSGDRIVTGSWNGPVQIWKADGSDRDDPLVLEGHERNVLSVAFSPSGDHIVTGSEDMTALIWKADGSDRKNPLVLQHQNKVNHAAFSPSGDHIVTGSGGGAAGIWKADGSDRDAPIVLQGHDAGVMSVAFSPSGDHIVTGSRDGTARIWMASWTAMLAHLREGTTECLAPDQRSRFLGESVSEAESKYKECERSHGRLGEAKP